MFCSSQALGLDHCTDAVVFGLKRSAELGLFSVNLMYLFSDKRQGKKCGRPNRLRMILSSPYGAATRGANLVPRSTIFLCAHPRSPNTTFNGPGMTASHRQ